MLERIDHVGIAVEDLDAAIEIYAAGLKMDQVHRESIEEQGVEAVLLDVGEGHIELMRPLGPDTPVGKFMARNGAGLHHIAYSVENVDAALNEAVEAGFVPIDKEPRIGIRGSRVAFLHPKSFGGVLTELVQPPEGH